MPYGTFYNPQPLIEAQARVQPIQQPPSFLQTFLKTVAGMGSQYIKEKTSKDILGSTDIMKLTPEQMVKLGLDVPTIMQLKLKQQEYAKTQEPVPEMIKQIYPEYFTRQKAKPEMTTMSAPPTFTDVFKKTIESGKVTAGQDLYTRGMGETEPMPGTEGMTMEKFSSIEPYLKAKEARDLKLELLKITESGKQSRFEEQMKLNLAKFGLKSDEFDWKIGKDSRDYNYKLMQDKLNNNLKFQRLNLSKQQTIFNESARAVDKVEALKLAKQNAINNFRNGQNYLIMPEETRSAYEKDIESNYNKQIEDVFSSYGQLLEKNKIDLSSEQPMIDSKDNSGILSDALQVSQLNKSYPKNSCGSVVNSILKNNGIDVTSMGVKNPNWCPDYQVLPKVSIDNAVPGDLVLTNWNGKEYGHIGIYAGSGKYYNTSESNNNKFTLTPINYDKFQIVRPSKTISTPEVKTETQSDVFGDSEEDFNGIQSQLEAIVSSTSGDKLQALLALKNNILEHTFVNDKAKSRVLKMLSDVGRKFIKTKSNVKKNLPPNSLFNVVGNDIYSPAKKQSSNSPTKKQLSPNSLFNVKGI